MFKYSFYDWCIDNNRNDLIDTWDKNKNNVNMNSISKSYSGKAFFTFKEATYSITVSNITTNQRFYPIKKYNNSFGSYLIKKYGNNAINRMWSKNNKINPFEIDKNYSKKIWMKCVNKDYHDDYLVTPNKVYTENCGCPYCASKIIHPFDSFGQKNIENFGTDWINTYWSEKNTLSPFEYAISSNKKIWIKCKKKEYHEFDTTPSYYNKYVDENGDFCPYCSHRRYHPNDNLGNKCPEIINVWSEKNSKTPYEVKPFSINKYWFKCENGIHDDYKRTPNDYYRDGITRCPRCVRADRESAYQKEINNYLNENYNYTLLHEYDCTIVPKNPTTKRLLPFDNELKEIKLIIEIHGGQHYSTHGWIETRARRTNRTPEEELEYLQWKDEYKKNYAVINGYHYLEIPYWTFEDKSYKNIIESKIKEIINLESVETAG